MPILVDYITYIICLLLITGLVYDNKINGFEALVILLTSPIYLVYTFWYNKQPFT